VVLLHVVVYQHLFCRARSEPANVFKRFLGRLLHLLYSETIIVIIEFYRAHNEAKATRRSSSRTGLRIKAGVTEALWHGRCKLMREVTEEGLQYKSFRPRRAAPVPYGVWLTNIRPKRSAATWAKKTGLSRLRRHMRRGFESSL